MSNELRAFAPWVTARGSGLVAVLAGFRVQARVGDTQALDWLSADDVGFDNFIHIGFGDVAVPDCVGVDDNIGPVFALIEAAGLVGSHSALQAALRQLLLEQLLQLGLGGGIAAASGMACWALVSAHEDMFVEFRHGPLIHLT